MIGADSRDSQADAQERTGLHNVIHETPRVIHNGTQERTPLHSLSMGHGLLFIQVCLLHSLEGIELLALFFQCNNSKMGSIDFVKEPEQT
jgi:hypothetical protein